MKIVGLMAVRNEADILRTNLLHHLSQGIDQFLIVDNGSTDSTATILKDAASSLPVSYTTLAGRFHQAEVLTDLAHQAFHLGADWIIPIDADEFWYAPAGNLRDLLTDAVEDTLRVEVVNFVQRREQLEKTSDGLLTMTWRVDQPQGPLDEVLHRVEQNEIAYVEGLYYPKWISRASANIEIGWGNHFVRKAGGRSATLPGVICLHAPLRSYSVLRSKADFQRPADEIVDYFTVSWHLRRWRNMVAAGTLGAEWEANSYQDGELNVYGAHRALLHDTALRDLVAPWIAQSPASSGLLERGVTPPTVLGAAPTEVEGSAPISSDVTEADPPQAEPDLIYGLGLVRNEADILECNLLWHLKLVDHILVIDNGSSDGSEEILAELSRTKSLQWFRYNGAYHQAELVTELAREAWRRGAAWILPFDADEFWTVQSKKSLRQILAAEDADLLSCQVINFVQSRKKRTRSPQSLETISWRVAKPVSPLDFASAEVEAGRIAQIEVQYPPKWISRTSSDIRIGKGNHSVEREGRRRSSSDIVCLHAPLRSFETLMAQAEHARRLDEAEPNSDNTRHVRRWLALSSTAGRMEDEWKANSYLEGALDVYGTKRPLVRDLSLRKIVSPILKQMGKGKRPLAAATASLTDDSHDSLSASSSIPGQRLEAVGGATRSPSSGLSMSGNHSGEPRLDDRIISAQRSQITELHRHVAVRDETVRALRVEIENTHEEVARRDRLIADLRAETEHLHREVAERDRRLKTIISEQSSLPQPDIEALQRQNADREKRLSEQHLELDRLHGEVRLRDERVESLSVEIARLHRNAATREREFQALHKETDRLHAEVRRRDARIEAVSKELAAMHDYVAAIEVVVDDSPGQTTRLHEASNRESLFISGNSNSEEIQRSFDVPVTSPQNPRPSHHEDGNDNPEIAGHHEISSPGLESASEDDQQ